MIPEDFNVEEFAYELSDQAIKAFPDDIPDEVKKFVTKIVYEFIRIAGNALNGEDRSYNVDETIFISQLVGEWMFHKGIDNYKKQIPQKYWKPILQQIAFSIFEVAKSYVIQKKNQNEIVKIVEKTVNEIYEKLIQQIADKNKISKSVVEEILSQLNIRDYVAHEDVMKIKEIKKPIVIETFLSTNKFLNIIYGGIQIVFLVCILFLLICGFFKIISFKQVIIIQFIIIFIEFCVLPAFKIVYIDVDKNNTLHTFIIKKDKRVYLNMWKNENIEKFTDKLFESGEIIIHLNDNTEAKINLAKKNAKVITQVKTLLIEHYPDKIPAKWLTVDKDVQK